MAINPDLLRFVSVDDLLGEDAPPLRIPDFQRPYSWSPRIARQLFSDIEDALDQRPGHRYIMGTTILLRRPGETHFEVVDGQQRLLTLHLLRSILRRQPLTALADGETPIHKVYRELRRLVAGRERVKGWLTSYRDFVDSKATMLQIVTDDEDEAFQFFDSQNFRGKALRPHDLLKAYHLREMAGASIAEQRAVVEQWEAAEENDLDRLFGTYLARIHWWSRNLNARPFTTEHLDLFKGVGRSTRRLPGAEYHRAAKAVLPAIQSWAQPGADEAEKRDLKRARHQLDAPISAGQAFFDFTTFMLDELHRLDTLLYRRGASNGAPDPDLDAFRQGARFRYCHELYVAAALYYTNKYSDADLPLIRRRLFRWAYGPRLAYERLGWKSADNYALGQPPPRIGLTEVNLFARMRDNLDPSALPLENIDVPASVSSRNEDDARLLTLLREVH